VEIAKEWGGKLLTDQYKNGHEKLKWVCFKGHDFELEGAKVRQGAWCQICRRMIGGMRRKVAAGNATNKDVLALARELGSLRFVK
jgi:hypothetical protein